VGITSSFGDHPRIYNKEIQIIPININKVRGKVVRGAGDGERDKRRRGETTGAYRCM
jgi:hypothetical protein